MLPAATTSRRRLLPLALALAAGGALLWWSHGPPSAILASSLAPCVAAPVWPAAAAAGADDAAFIPVSQLVALGQAELTAAQDDYFSSGQAKRDVSELGLHLGAAEDLTLDGYRRAVERSLERYFDPRPSWADAVLARLSILGSAAADDPPPRQADAPGEIYTTSHSPVLPTQFKGWSELNPAWAVRFLDDDALEDWVRATFPDADLQLEWDLLASVDSLTTKERKVLKADLFRYLVLLDRGGVYTDSDTASVRPIEQWGRNPSILTTPLQTLLPALVSLPFSSPSAVLAATRAQAGPPTLVVALEADAPRSGDLDRWRAQSFSRGMQVVQWTLLANAPGHPVLLDAAARALDQLRAGREAGAGQPSVLELTGPGLFTDCLFRYLFARYGVHPRALSGHAGPVRVGDVLVLPHRAMQADMSEHASDAQDVVWHGFSGRWKETD